MNTINEMCLAWYMWVNGNYDILIMTITLIVVAGLVLEVVRLKSKVNRLNANMYHHVGEQMSLLQADQVNVNVHLVEDIAELQKKLKAKKK
jgi:hypothetical protein